MHGKRVVCKTVVGKLLYMCQDRADILYSVMETARKITCPTESDEMNVKCIAGLLKGVPNAKCLIEINTIPLFVNGYTDSDWARQQQTCTNTSGGVTQWRSATLSAWSRTQESVSLSSAQAELYALATGIDEDMATKHLSNELGYESICKGMGIQARAGSNETCNVEVHVRARCRGEEADDTCLRQHEFVQKDLMTL